MSLDSIIFIKLRFNLFNFKTLKLYVNKKLPSSTWKKHNRLMSKTFIITRFYPVFFCYDSAATIKFISLVLYQTIVFHKKIKNDILLSFIGQIYIDKIINNYP